MSPPSERAVRFRKWLRRSLLSGCSLAIGYALFLLIGMIPVNRSFEPTPGGITVFIRSSAVHADLVLPVEQSSCDWREYFPSTDMKGPIGWATHVAIGWGDRGFYLDTPTWDDLHASTALNALLLPSGSVLHVEYTGRIDEDAAVQRIDLSESQYRSLCQSIRRSFTHNPPLPIEGEHYNRSDAFYEAVGSYHCFYTCNSWVGRRLADAGVATPLWTPLPGSPGWYLD